MNKIGDKTPVSPISHVQIRTIIHEWNALNCKSNKWIGKTLQAAEHDRLPKSH